ncbi:4'-phosphopantetheinyl transferase superfamily protein [Gelidibacter salicanalis]|uniref:4'-phosphopantetheinyl transferase superfamily protein n=1 Tax=Gelidibacter salicanalis TaxID=291193 RepID=A0A5C7AJJ5_9FLAO|nr:4'-phosphopantetheinyl transferase superfamily protein [Gelidibacter salicanalis]TXE05972.1 4'-phosphopantetheinyl transferase superfamily protein [Gelidibacter salicanalis]
MYPIKPNIIHTYYVNTDTDKSYANLLSQEETLKASKFKFKKNRNQLVVSRGALRILSGKYLNKDPKEIGFKYGEFGKPDFDLETPLNFNISHSGTMAILAFVLDHAIGVDIEKIKPDFDVMEIASNFFSDLEIEALNKIPKNKLTEAFYRCWTRKESFIKAKAQGLSFPLDSFSVCINSTIKTEVLETKWEEAEKNNWSLFTFSPNQDYIGAISVKGQIESVEYYDFKHY